MPACPECGARVASSATTCPICEASLSGDSPRRRSKSSSAKRTKKKKSSGTGLLIGLLIGVPLLFIFSCIGLALLLPAVQAARNAARKAAQNANAAQPGAADQPSAVERSAAQMKLNERDVARQSLQQIGLATHQFHDVHGRFPPQSTASMRTTNREAPQSWMTDLLPFFDDGRWLSERINRNLPWTDPSMATHYQTVVPRYLNPAIKGSDKNAQGYGLAHFAANSLLITPDDGHRIRDITDGSSSTILAATVTDGFKPWGDPSNIRDPSRGFGGGAEAFGTPHDGLALVLMADGSVRLVKQSLDADICAKLANPADGQVIPRDWAEPVK